MNIERRKEMGLEIGRAIHLHIDNQDKLYDEIMKVATSFCDKTSIACGMAMVNVDTSDLPGEDDETKEIIPE